MADKIFIGRRKTAVARVILRNGDGKVMVNKKEFDNYFPMKDNREQIEKPLTVTENKGKFDILINVRGGGISGQADAAKLGIARALVDLNADYRGVLKAEGLLKRDPRMVERKKYGRPKARKRFQFSKR